MKGGVKQQLKDEFSGRRPLTDVDTQVDMANNSMSRQRTFATGGRKRARTIGQYFTSMMLIGRLSAPELQEGAAAAKNSSTNSCDTLIDELAKAGNAGSQRGNCHRDVVSKLGARAEGTPQCYAAKVKFWNIKEALQLLGSHVLHAST